MFELGQIYHAEMQEQRRKVKIYFCAEKVYKGNGGNTGKKFAYGSYVKFDLESLKGFVNHDTEFSEEDWDNTTWTAVKDNNSSHDMPNGKKLGLYLSTLTQ